MVIIDSEPYSHPARIKHSEEEASEAIQRAAGHLPTFHLRVERGPDSMLGQAQPPGLPTKFIFQTPVKLWFDRRPSFNYRIVAIEIEEVR